MKVDKGLGMVGLATKAGKVASGEFMTENAVKSGMAYLSLFHRRHQTTPKRNLETCVNFIMCQSKNVGQKMNLESLQERHFVHLWQ